MVQNEFKDGWSQIFVIKAYESLQIDGCNCTCWTVHTSALDSMRTWCHEAIEVFLFYAKLNKTFENGSFSTQDRTTSCNAQKWVTRIWSVLWVFCLFWSKLCLNCRRKAGMWQDPRNGFQLMGSKFLNILTC